MQAIVLIDPFDNPDALQALYDHLIGFKVVIIKSVRELNVAKVLIDLEAPCLFYKNIFTRLENPKEIWLHHNSMRHIKVMKVESEVISFIPAVLNNYARDINTFVYQTPDLSIINRKIYSETPKKKPLCFLYTHNRDIYLQLTLNSLLFATQNIELKIILNAPTPKVEKVALEFAEKYSCIELFKTDNAFISATNLMLQWFNPERFIFMEDDHIYPSSTKEFFPEFCNQFIDRLDYFDLCVWKVTMDNALKYMACRRNTFEFLENEWEIWEPGTSQMIMAQCVSCKTDYYKNVLREYKDKDANVKKYMACYDSHLIKHAKSVCHPSLRGYHIGWNQQMDGFPKLTDESRNPIFKSTLFEVKSLNTGEKRKLDVRDLLN